MTQEKAASRVHSTHRDRAKPSSALPGRLQLNQVAPRLLGKPPYYGVPFSQLRASTMKQAAPEPGAPAGVLVPTQKRAPPPLRVGDNYKGVLHTLPLHPNPLKRPHS